MRAWRPARRKAARAVPGPTAAGSRLLAGPPRVSAAMPMKGRFPIRRTLQYLAQGTVVFKDSVKVMTVNYNTHGELGEGARKFVFFNIPQIQYKNPWVQIMMFKNMTPTPFLRFYLDSGEQVLVDVETKTNKEIVEHVRKILGKSEVTPSTFQWADRAWPHQPQERPPPVRRGRSTLRPPTLMPPPLDRTGGGAHRWILTSQLQLRWQKIISAIVLRDGICY
ncbi:28S ribosomal protein S25, mitochondrial isoform X1 [Marmota marmota marmota]|uniref:28S ribosomal protein S25, mitochondrial isoform X1 n=1 Tax=Marmota marmota marmota TaxID=9994 RepID=UPI002092091A|nr:28S ribosomal protein S25, mitochondrial isoform X1 [Marmota marmota marmota]